MAVYNVKVDLYIDGADQSDAWAQGLVEWVVDQCETLAAQARVVDGLSAGERQSYAMAGAIIDGRLEVSKAFHVTAGGPVDGLPGDEPDPEQYPAWLPWPGSGPTYQAGDRVTHNGSTWESTSPNNVWEPGVFGWVVV